MNSSWLLLLYGLPTRQNSERVSLWRRLKKFGALPLKTSAYVLPDQPSHFERFQWLAKQIKDDGGDATLIKVTEIEGMPNEKIVELFNEARAKDYAELTAGLSDFIRQKKKHAPEELLSSLEKFQRRYQELHEIDYFDCPKAQDAQMLLKQAESLASKKGAAAPRLERREYAGRMWLTRPHPQIDRVGSAWLIRRFIDADAKFVFASSPKDYPKAIPYDMFEVEFSHHGDECTFETLIKRFSIEDKAVHAMAEMIHDADLEDDKYQRVECRGLDLLLSGWNKLKLKDDEILARGFESFDALYAALKR